MASPLWLSEVVTAEPTMSFTSACVFSPGKEGGLVKRFQARAPGGLCMMLSECALPQPPGLCGNWFWVKNRVSVNPG